MAGLRGAFEIDGAFKSLFEGSADHLPAYSSLLNLHPHAAAFSARALDQPI